MDDLSILSGLEHAARNHGWPCCCTHPSKTSRPARGLSPRASLDRFCIEHVHLPAGAPANLKGDLPHNTLSLLSHALHIEGFAAKQHFDARLATRQPQRVAVFAKVLPALGPCCPWNLQLQEVILAILGLVAGFEEAPSPATTNCSPWPSTLPVFLLAPFFVFLWCRRKPAREAFLDFESFEAFPFFFFWFLRAASDGSQELRNQRYEQHSKRS